MLRLPEEFLGDFDTLRLLRGIALDAEQIDLEQEHLLRAIDLGGAHAGTLYNLALLHYQQGSDDAAIPLLDRAIELSPDDASACLVLAQALHRGASKKIARCSIDTAHADRERLLQLDLDDHRALFNLGTLPFAANRADRRFP